MRIGQIQVIIVISVFLVSLLVGGRNRLRAFLERALKRVASIYDRAFVCRMKLPHAIHLGSIAILIVQHSQLLVLLLIKWQAARSIRIVHLIFNVVHYRDGTVSAASIVYIARRGNDGRGACGRGAACLRLIGGRGRMTTVCSKTNATSVRM